MTEQTVEHFASELASLKVGEFSGFDPIGLAYLESLFQRLTEARHANNRVLIDSAFKSLARYRTELDSQKKAAEQALASIERHAPAYLDAANQSYSRGSFKAVISLRAGLDKKAAGNASKLTLVETSARNSALSELLACLNNDQADLSDQEPSQSLDELFRAQEDQALIESNAVPGKLNTALKDGSGEQLELQSMKNYRDAMKYFDVDQLIDRAINECPENPGPHNPQMLAVKALMQMRDLSPQYLRRFAGYVEAMLWVEKNSVKLTATKIPS